ncbi:MAG: hypothetical protein JWO94_1971 [Verrucomicrobiaceae bacterium]|nr:hypothetical protein [Verrucomicrobiaceae bacterium]
MPTLRIFISSPGDVAEERDRARQVVESLRRRYAGRFFLKPVLWEELPLQADISFQQGIDLVLSKEQGIDIAVIILWSRLGSPLSALIRKADNTEYRSGTERELDLMLEARKQSGGTRPALMVYTRQDPASFDERLRGKPAKEQKDLIAQKLLVEQFIAEEFHDGGSGHNVRAYHNFDRPVTFSQRLRSHLVELLDELAGGGMTEAVWDTEKQGPPFLGLEAFQPRHADVFFGREVEVLEARHALREQARNGCAFLLLSGASGSGKSSLARAGVLPAIVENELDEQVSAWRTVIVTPLELGTDPLTGLVRRLAASEALPDLRGETDALGDLIDGLRSDPALTVRLRIKDAFARAARHQGGGVRVLLVLDQLEELFATAAISDNARREFLEAVEALARSGHVWVLATVRSDFWAQVQSEPALVRMTEGGGLLPVLAPETDALRRLIEEPARLAGLAFELRDGQSLADRILRDAAAHAELLPLLEYVLRELFEQRTGQRLLTWQAYEKLGGVEGALKKCAADVFATLSIEARAALLEILPLLVATQRNDSRLPVRTQAPMSLLTSTPARKTLTLHLIGIRFLTTDDVKGQPVAILAHDALLNCWPDLQAWLNVNHALLESRDHVRLEAARWSKEQQNDAAHAGDWLLAEGLPLSRGEAALGAGLLDEPEAAFVNLSRDKVRAKQAGERRRTLLLHLSAVVAIAVLGAISWYATQKGNEVRGLLAESDYDKAERLFTENDAPSALWYLSRAVATGTAPVQAADRLVFALTQRSWPLPVIPPVQLDAEVLAVTFDPSGKRFATATRSGKVTVWSTADGRQIGTALSHPKPVRGARFSPDGQYLLTACDDAIARIWDVRTEAYSLAGSCKHENVVAGIAWSADGKTFATASWDTHVRLWDRDNPAAPLFTGTLKDKAHTVAFQPASPRRLLGVAKDEVTVWDTVTGREVFHLQAGADLNGALFSPEGASVLAFGEDRKVRLASLDPAAGADTPLASTGPCSNAAFSPDGSLVALASGPQVLFYETAPPHQQLLPFDGTVRVSALKFSADGARLLIGCDDGRVEVYAPRGNRRVSEPMWDAGSPFALDYHPDQHRVLCARGNRTVSLWSLSVPRPLPSGAMELGAPPLALEARNGVQAAGENGCVRFLPPSPPAKTGGTPATPPGFDFGTSLTSARQAPQGEGFIGGTSDGHVIFRTGGTGQPPQDLGAFAGAVTYLAFATDGSLLAAGTESGATALWRWPARTPLPGMPAHEDKVSGLALLNSPARLFSTGWDRQLRTTPLGEGGGPAPAQAVKADPVVTAASPSGRQAVIALANGELWLAGDDPRNITLLPMKTASQPLCLALSADGRRAAVGLLSGHVEVFDLVLQSRVADLPCGDSQVNALAFAGKNGWLAVAMEEGFTQVWDANTGRRVSEPLRHQAPVRLVQFSADSQTLASADRGGLVQTWPLGGVADAVALARQILDTTPREAHRAAISAAVLKALPPLDAGPYLDQLRQMKSPAAPFELKLIESALR